METQSCGAPDIQGVHVRMRFKEQRHDFAMSIHCSEVQRSLLAAGALCDWPT